MYGVPWSRLFQAFDYGEAQQGSRKLRVESKQPGRAGRPNRVSVSGSVVVNHDQAYHRRSSRTSTDRETIVAFTRCIAGRCQQRHVAA